MRKRKNVAGLGAVMLSAVIFVGSSLNVVAAEEVVVETVDDSYEQDIMSTDISLEDKYMLLEDEAFEMEYNEMQKEGWVLQDIDVEICEMSGGNFGQSQTFATSTTKEGKVVSKTYVQPTKIKKVYNNKIYAKAQDAKKTLAIASNFAKCKYAWIASTLFSIDTSQLAPFWNTGYQKLEENATYYSKSAYYKKGNKYWIGYGVSKLKTAGSVMTYYRDSKSTPHQKSVDYSKTFKSPNYNKSNTYLVNLAKKHYTHWIDEKMTISSTVRIK
jgi:hypothetical protein